ncbi:MAG TPA: Tat pathway signal protein [Micromonosporaceae bacterium]|nr:Tat pathway signal protein [Micromonosporaceae bacterium]
MTTSRNRALQHAIAQCGASYDALARDIRQIAAENGTPGSRTNKSLIAHWVAGARPMPATARYLAEALARRLGRPVSLAEIGLASDETETVDTAVSADPVAAITALGRADVDRRTLLGKTAVYSLGALLLPLTGPEPAARAATVRSKASATIGEADVDAVRSVIAAFNAADEKLGGGHGRSAVVEYLATDVAAYLRARFASDTVRNAMFGVAAQLAYLAGWKAHDLGMTGLAQRYYLHATDLAGESDPAQVAYCLRILAHQAMDLGHHEHCVDLADAALQRTTGRVDPDTESLFWLTAARAHATAGSPRPARATLRRAERVLARSRSDQAPAWVSLGGPAQARLTTQTGKTLRALGDLPAAEEQFVHAARCWDPTTHPRIHALTLAELAEVQCQRGIIEAACQTWNRALDIMGGIRSARTREAVTTLRGHLAPYRRRGPSAVHRLDARAAAFLHP